MAGPGKPPNRDGGVQHAGRAAGDTQSKASDMHFKVNGMHSKVNSMHFKAGDIRSETGNIRLETGNIRLETNGRAPRSAAHGSRGKHRIRRLGGAVPR